MLNDLDFAPTHERADYCDPADEAAEPAIPSSAGDNQAVWEEHPYF